MTSPTSEEDQISLNIAAVQDFYNREAERLSNSQRLLERVSAIIGRPAFVALSLPFVVGWILVEEGIVRWGYAGFDPAPYAALQGILTLSSLLVGTVVLIKQNRLNRLTEQRANRDLKVALLTEQKVAKLIDLIEELRRDLPNVHNRHDPSAMDLQQAMSPSLVLSALDSYQGTSDLSRDKVEAEG